MRTIFLTNGGESLVDDDMFEYLNQWKWYNHRGYAERMETVSPYKQKGISMHRIVVDTPDDLMTDHINHNTLDNRRENLRICTGAQNQRNQLKQKRKTTSIFKGVTFHKQSGTWHAQLRQKGKYIFSRYVKTELEAAKLYNEAASKHFGEFAYLNEL